MPNTVVSIVALVALIVPGFLAERLHRRILGIATEEKDWVSWLRMLSYSVLGLMGYTALPLTPPHHVIPDSYGAVAFGHLAWSYAGHIGISLLLAVTVSAVLSQGFPRFRKMFPTLTWVPSQSFRSSTWAKFARDDVPGRWVVVTLESGNAYVGILDSTDVDGPTECRDILLREPAAWNESKKCYEADGLQRMFLPAGSVRSVATYYDPDDDTRVTAAFGPLFQEEPCNDPRETIGARTEGADRGEAGTAILAASSDDATEGSAADPTRSA